MNLKFKNTFIGYYQFYYHIIGYKFFINLGLCIAISFLDGIGLAMFIPLLQSVGANGEIRIERLGLDLTMSTLLGLLVLLFILKGLTLFLQLNYQVNLRHLFIKKVRFALVDSLAQLSYNGFLKLDAGKIQNTLTTEVQRLFQSMSFYFNAAQSLAMLLTYVVLAFFANYQFAFLVAVGAGLSNFVYRRIYLLTKASSLELSKKGHYFNGFLIESVHYFKYLKSTNYFSVFSSRLKKVIISAEDLNKRMGFYGAVTSAVREPLIMVIVALVIFIQVTWLGSSIASIILSLLLFYRALTFLMAIQNNWQSFIQSIGAMDSVSSITTLMQQEREEFNTRPFPGFTIDLALKDISLSYGENKIIDHLNLHIPKNNTIALIGESGSGKTTLANILSSLIAPNEGQLLVDGVDLKSYNLNSYRNRIGYISQEPVIFNDDIFNNVTFWAEKSAPQEKRFWKAIELASLTEFIHSQPAKEHTLLGDNGILISGGQKQRISIARELYKNPEILILDEATSALDSETEKVIQDNIQQLHGNYTMVIIAHRLSTIKEADMIYLIEKGKIIDSGTFQELLSDSKRFKVMVSLQAFGE